MSIWRTISCSKCKNDRFEIADNGMDLGIRVDCPKCGEQMFLPDKKEKKLPEFLQGNTKQEGKQ